jgi:hypothetical protein
MPADAATRAEQPGGGGRVSIPGADIPSPEGSRSSSPASAVRATRAQCTQVLSSCRARISRAPGEGDIAGALQRVTGLSVVGSGFVYVRGLGDRYSLSLLNGSPLPSPEPLRRVVPLDIFPTSIVASALVQKSFSPISPANSAAA